MNTSMNTLIFKGHAGLFDYLRANQEDATAVNLFESHKYIPANHYSAGEVALALPAYVNGIPMVLFAAEPFKSVEALDELEAEITRQIEACGFTVNIFLGIIQ